jgi:hypothetical protein
MPKAIERDTLPAGLKPFRFHGLDLSYKDGDKNATCLCPFCGKEGKFTILAETSQWRCFSCNEGFEKKDNNGHAKSIKGGNATEFLRLLWKYCDAEPCDYTELVKDRTLLSPVMLVRWEVVKSFLTGEWLMPAYNIKGELIQLYRYVNCKNPKTGEWKRKLIPTPEVGGHGLFGMSGFDSKRPIIDVFESWNGVVYEEVISQIGMNAETEKWEEVGKFKDSLGAERNVIGLPGCATFDSKWMPLFKDRVVNFWFDNDHPQVNERNGQSTTGAGWLYSCRNSSTLLKVAKSVQVLKWGEQGFDPELTSGYDVRDALKAHKSLLGRSAALFDLKVKLQTVAANEVVSSANSAAGDVNTKLRPKTCTDFKTLVNSWKKPMRWRQEMEDALAICLAVGLSTEQVGDQLFLMLIADAGSGKTCFCDALLVAENSYPVENVTGLYSGWQGGGFSPLERMNRKMWITAEGDTVVQHPAFPQFMSQIRRAFDGKGHATFKNSKEDQLFDGLRFTWLLAGTPTMIDLMNNQASLGDRFLKFFIGQPDDDERRQILMRSAYSAKRAVQIKSGDDAEHQLDPALCEAYQLTGGYLNWLRSNTDLLAKVEMDDERLMQCADLGEFTACLRARPGKTKTDEAHDAKEMPTRLTKQFVRVAMCLAVVCNRGSVDQHIMDLVRKLTLDTSMGVTLQIVKQLYAKGNEGLSYGALAQLVSMTNDKVKSMLRFLHKLKIVAWYEPIDEETQKKLPHKWRVTKHMAELYKSVIVDWGQ